jgi:hypothetical protein
MKLIEMIAKIVSEAECSDDRGCGSSVLEPEAVAAAITARLHECVKPLVWRGVEDDCFVVCDLGYRQYHLCVCDTLELPGYYVWRASYVEGTKADVYVGQGTYVEAKSTAQAHYAAQIIAGLDL